jgi:hypothetical protein
MDGKRTALHWRFRRINEAGVAPRVAGIALLEFPRCKIVMPHVAGRTNGGLPIWR